jgi:hypothetical protein
MTCVGAALSCCARFPAPQRDIRSWQGVQVKILQTILLALTASPPPAAALTAAQAAGECGYHAQRSSSA